MLRYYTSSFIFTLLILCLSSAAHAVCSNNEDGNPGQDGEIEFFTPENVLRYCDDTNWVDMVDVLDTLRNGLVGHWKLDETSGTTATDSGTGGNDGTMTGGLDAGNDTTSGAVATALNFDGTDDNIDITDPGNLYQTLPLTISGWFKMDQLPSAAGNDFHIARRRQLSSPWYAWTAYVDDPTNIMTFEIRDTGSTNYRLDGDAALSAGQWYHWVVTADSSNNVTLYINDVAQVDTETMSNPIYQSTDNELVIGTSNGATQAPFDGDLDDIRIYNRVLSGAEITDLYNSGHPPPIGHWRLDETGATTTAVDSSANGNDATMYSGLSGSNSVSGVIGTGLEMNVPGDFNQFLETADVATFGGLTAFSVSFWANLDRLNGHKGLFTIPGVGWARYNWNNGDFRFAANGWSGGQGFWRVTAGSQYAQIGKWQHVVVTYDYNAGIGHWPTFYFDGVPAISMTRQNAPAGTYTPPATSQMVIGAQGGSEMKGSMDDFRIYDRVLSASEVKRLNGCTGPGSYFYNSTDDVMQWCEGLNSAINMHVPASGAGGCTSPTASEGALNYDTDRYKACDGNGWIDIGK